MSTIPTHLLRHVVQVQPLTGTGAYGDRFGAEFNLQCFASGTRRMVRDSDGAETLSTLTLIAAPGKASLVPPGSRVKWRGDVTVVIGSAEMDDGGMGAPQHTEVTCE